MSDQRSRLIGPWVLLGSGLAIAVTGGVLYGLAYAEYGNHEQFESLQALDDWASTVESRAIAGDVLVGVGAAAAVGGLVWLLLTRRAIRRNASASSTTRLNIGAAPTRTGGFALSLEGSF